MMRLKMILLYVYDSSFMPPRNLCLNSISLWEKATFRKFRPYHKQWIANYLAIELFVWMNEKNVKWQKEIPIFLHWNGLEKEQWRFLLFFHYIIYWLFDSKCVVCHQSHWPRWNVEAWNTTDSHQNYTKRYIMQQGVIV